MHDNSLKQPNLFVGIICCILLSFNSQFSPCPLCSHWGALSIIHPATRGNKYGLGSTLLELKEGSVQPSQASGIGGTIELN